MAKRQEERYVFDASAGTLKVPGHIELEALLAVINVTRETIIFATGTLGKGATRQHEHLPLGQDADFPYSLDGTCTFTFDFDTAGAGMADNDRLLVYYEDELRGLTIRPFDAAVDAVERIKVSNPQSLIDADFEYGLQDTKWQNLGVNRGKPSFYTYEGPQEDITSISSDGASPFSNITVTYAVASPGIGLTITAIEVSGLDNERDAEGIFIPFNDTGTTSVYKAKGVVAAGTINTPYTQVKVGAAYSESAIAIQTATGNAAGTISLTTTQEHGLFPGSPIVFVDSNTGAQPYDGRFFISTVTSGTEFDFDIQADATGGISLETTSLFALNDSIFTHRPFDGGVEVGVGLPVAGQTAKRQTKRYFRYQSGKAINYSTGVLFNPVYDLRQADYDSGLGEIEFKTQIEHGLQTGIGIEIDGIETSGYDGTYLVKRIEDAYTFVVDAIATPAATPAIFSDFTTVGINTWTGSTIKTGMFDDLNGVYWEYDGQEINVVKRSSTYQLAGTIDVTTGITTVTQGGTPTKFTEQLTVGDCIQIRGGAYFVTSITSDTELHISPSFRGVTVSNVQATKVKEERIPQRLFNFDKLDGTGPSGYKMPLYGSTILMQMVGIQYSWYGAGHVDYMIRGPLGDWIIAHRIANNNRNIEAYMRSGNLPTKYEISNGDHGSPLTVATGLTTSVLNLKDASRFPTPSATYPEYVYLTSNQSGTIRNEIMSYTGKTGNQLTGVTTATSYTAWMAGQNRSFSAGERFGDGSGNNSYDHPVGTGVILMSRFSPNISHWGSSVIMDGTFDEDDGYVFTLSKTIANFPSSSTQTVLLFRPAPSVSDSLPGEYGQREVTNRSITKIRSVQIGNPQGRNLEIAAILNPRNLADITWLNCNEVTIAGGLVASQPSFAQYENTTTTLPTDGQVLFRFLNSSGTVDFKVNQEVKELQNSILGGNYVYPDGPETLALVIRNNSGQTADIDIILSWTEAQA
jgi:hypothetical protein